MEAISQTPIPEKKPWLETPLLHSLSLSKLANCQIYLKLENLQPSGSFKSRAMGNQILSHLSKISLNENNNDSSGKKKNRKIHFFASSGGNAGLAAVCAARSLGYPCTVVVPLSTSEVMIERLWGAGAEDVIRFGETFAEAGGYMKDVVMKGLHRENQKDGCGEKRKNEDENEEEEGTIKIALHPFDDESIWEGNSTIIDELERQLPLVIAGADSPEKEQHKSGDDIHTERPLPIDAIICSVGGGGLMNGLIMGLERLSQQKQPQPQSKNKKGTNPIHILATETKGTHSLALSLSHKTLTSLPHITSKATSLGAVRVSERTFQYALNPPEGVKVHSVVLSDAEAARGTLKLVDSERVLVELACGVCVDVAVGEHGPLPSFSREVSGTEMGNGNENENKNRSKKRKREEAGPESAVQEYGCRSRYPYPYTDGISSSSSSSSTDNETEESNSNLLSDSTSPSSPSSPGTEDTTPLPTDTDADPDADVGLSTSRFKSRLHQLVPGLTPRSRVVIIVCGGSNVTVDMAAEWRRMSKERWLE